MAGRTSIVNAGAVIAVLLGLPCVFIFLYGLAGVITGKKIIAGMMGAAWAGMAVIGAYELNRRKFAWQKGAQHADLHLLAGTIAVLDRNDDQRRAARIDAGTGAGVGRGSDCAG